MQEGRFKLLHLYKLTDNTEVFSGFGFLRVQSQAVPLDLILEQLKNAKLGTGVWLLQGSGSVTIPGSVDLAFGDMV